MKIVCPLLRKPCLEHGCAWYVTIHGTDPQTGVALSPSMCVMVADLKVGIEGNKEVRQSAAAIESMRNENVRNNLRAIALLSDTQMKFMEDKRDAKVNGSDHG